MPGSTSTPRVPAAWNKYIEGLAPRFATGMFGIEDAIQAGITAYLKADKQYNPVRGPFEHYAKAAIRKALITARQGEQRHWRNRAALPGEESGVDVSPTPWAEEEERVEAIGLRRKAEAIARWRRSLPAKLKATCNGLYFDDQSQRTLAAQEGVSQARISQRNSQLLARAREDLSELEKA